MGIAQAEDLAAAGNMHGSRVKMDEAEEFKAKASDWKKKLGQVIEICDICGSSKESDIGIDGQFPHTMGKTHKGYVVIRKMHAELKEAEDRGELKFEPFPVEDSEDRERRRHDRSRSAKADRKTSSKVDKEDRRGDRDRDRNEKTTERDRRSRRHEEEDDRGSRRRRDDEASSRKREEEVDAFGRSTKKVVRDRREDTDRRRREKSEEPKRRESSESPQKRRSATPESRSKPPPEEPPPPPPAPVEPEDPETIEEWNVLAARIDAGGLAAMEMIAGVFACQLSDVKAWRELWRSDRSRAMDGPISSD